MGCCNEQTTSRISVLATESTPTTPQRANKVQDVFFLMLFVLTMGGMACLCYYSVKNGDPYRYLYGKDSWGNVCRRKENQVIEGVSLSGMDHSDRKFEFHMGLANVRTALNPLSYIKSNEKPAVFCVKECPTKMIKCRDFLIENGYNLSTISDTLFNNHICTMLFQTILPHNTLFNRCVPSQLIQIGASITAERSDEEANNTIISKVDDVIEESWAASFAKHVITSLLKYNRDIIYLTLLTNVFCLVVVVMLQIFTKAGVLVCLIVGALGSILFTGNLWYSYGLVKGYVTEEQFEKSVRVVQPASESLLNFIEDRPNNESNSSLNLDVVAVDRAYDALAFGDIKESQYLLPWAILSTIFTFILIFILIHLKNSIFLVVKIFEEACFAITKMPGLLLEPIKAMVAYLNVLSYFFLIGSFILTIQKPEIDHRNFVVYSRGDNSMVPTLFLAHIFGCLWLMAFISGCLQMVLAGAVSKWFFDRGEKREARKGELGPGLHVKCKANTHTARATVDLILYNLGTVAFGSLIIAIVQTARIVLEYMQRQLHGRESKMAQNLFKALRCCLLCFERFLKYINKNAYICSAMYGYGFFRSAKRAFTLIINNAQHAMALSCIGSVCNFIGKIAVVSLTAMTSIVYFVYYRIGKEALLSEYFVPLVTICIGSFVIAHCYFTVYQIAIDTIFLCFCDDQERNNGDDRPYYSSVGLQSYMNETSKKESSEKPEPRSVPVESARCSMSLPPVALPNLEKLSESQNFTRSMRAFGLPRKNRNNICASKFWIERESISPSSSRSGSNTGESVKPSQNEEKKTNFETCIETKINSNIKILFHQSNRIQSLSDSHATERRMPTPFPTSNSNLNKPNLPQISIPGQTFSVSAEEYFNYDLLSILSLSSDEKQTPSKSIQDHSIAKLSSDSSIFPSEVDSFSTSTTKNSWKAENSISYKDDSSSHHRK